MENKYKLRPEDIGELWIGEFKEGHSSDCPFLKDYSYGDLFLGRLWFNTSTAKSKTDLKI